MTAPVRMKLLVLGLAVALAGALAGCDQFQDRHKHKGGKLAQDSEISPSVVSVVDGHSITLAQVAERMQGSGLPPKDVLAEIQSEALLERAARLGGYELREDVVRLRKQALVQWLLRIQIEEKYSLATIRDDFLEDMYRQQRDRFNQPRLYHVAHVLTKLAEDARVDEVATAEQFSRSLIRTLQKSAAPEETMVEQQGVHGGLTVTAEALPPVHAKAPLVQPFLDAVLRMKEPGVIPEPIRTMFGYHVIYIRRIDPPRVIPRQEAFDVLGGEESLLRQSKEFNRIADALRDQSPVTKHEASIEVALGKPLRNEEH